MYKKMYHLLFNAITDALNENDIYKMRNILMNAQLETEEIYMSYGEDDDGDDSEKPDLELL